MQRRVMQATFLKVLAIALLMSLTAFGQSLGDIARENREKQDGESAPPTAKPKVITNADLPKDPDAKQGPREAQPGASAAASSQAADHLSEDHLPVDQRSGDQHLADRRVADRRSAEQRLAEQRAADQWKRRILAQRNKTATLQAQTDQLKASIRSEYGTVGYETPYNSYQARQLQRVAQIQRQLDEQKRKLDQMQEAARHAGMHTAVYDP
ncbi:MAG: hypothetical protein ABSA80_02510 [Terriglobales bacterium]